MTDVLCPDLSSHEKNFLVDPICPFSVGIEYYRPPVPPMELWDKDFARIRAAGMTIVRMFLPWNWVETADGQFEFSDLDRFFELAQKHDLKVWMDLLIGTHCACPEWLTKKFPDMRVEWADGTIQQPRAAGYAAQGMMIHNYDHPQWRIHSERYVRAIVSRYKDHPAMGVWGTWDGINLSAAWIRDEPSYNSYTIEKYKNWLRHRYTLDELNSYLMRRCRSWDDVEAPRNNQALVEMMLYRQFHYENMADHLGWVADLIDRLDGRHEQRSHGGPFPRPWDELCSRRIDSWGLSHRSGERLTSDNPFQMADEFLGYQWSRSIGRGGRWWNEEIYSNFIGGLGYKGKRTIPEEAAVYLWLTLIEGAAGALYWQYRPEYMTFEAPGLSLISLDGEPMGRWKAVEQAIRQINSLSNHLPLTVPRADIAVGYSSRSEEIFTYANQDTSFGQNFKDSYRVLWANNIPRDVVTPGMDWSEYKLIYLPNFAVLDEKTIAHLRQSLTTQTGPSIIADGLFGSFAAKGHWSFHPPEGLSDLIQTRLTDFDTITESDIRKGKNIVKTDFGDFPILRPCQYSILEPRGRDRAFATLNNEVVGIQTENRRLTWLAFPLAATAAPLPLDAPQLLLSLVNSFKIPTPFEIKGSPIIAFHRRSKAGGSLIFTLNLLPTPANTTIKPNWPITTITDLLNKKTVPITQNTFNLELAFGEIKVFHTPDLQ
jgi:hypothetical protein